MSSACPKQKLVNNALDIEIFNHQRDLLIDHCYVRKVLKTLCVLKNVETHKVILHFVTAETICEVHDTVFGDPSFTDCVTCPIDTPDQELPYHVLGECFICPLAAIQSAPQTPHQELLLYIVHCFLHMLGYEDTHPQQRDIMQHEEQRLLKALNTEIA